MSLKCFLGMHKWTGCKCSACGTTRDEGHDWSKDCEKCNTCGVTRKDSHDRIKSCEVCVTCGKALPYVRQHDWSKDCAACTRCGKAKEHYWSKDCQVCATCGKTRDKEHKWVGCKCSFCAKIRDEGHTWEVLHLRDRCVNCGTERTRCGMTAIHAAAWAKECGITKWEIKDRDLDIIVPEKERCTPEDTAVSILPLLRTLNCTSVRIVVTYTEYTPEHTYFVNDPDSPRYGENTCAESREYRSEEFYPLLLAAKKGLIDVVGFLLAKNYDVNRRYYGSTPLSYAVFAGHSKVVELLLASGADVTASFANETDKSFSELAAKIKDSGIMTLLRRNIHRAVEDDNLDIVKELLRDDATLVSRRLPDGETPLHRARSRAMAEILLANKAEVDARDTEDMTPLFHAAMNGSTEVAEVLLAYGADANATEGRWKTTPLYCAASNGHDGVAKVLLANKAFVDPRTNNGMTPLMRAKTRAVAEVLLAYGADGKIALESDKSMASLSSSTAFHLSRDVVELLRIHCSK